MSVPSIRILRPNLTRVETNGVQVFYSYETPIAFDSPDHGVVLSENLWSTTTGKHLNYVSRTAQRIPREEFVTKLNEALRLS